MSQRKDNPMDEEQPEDIGSPLAALRLAYQMLTRIENGGSYSTDEWHARMQVLRAMLPQDDANDGAPRPTMQTGPFDLWSGIVKL